MYALRPRFLQGGGRGHRGGRAQSENTKITRAPLYISMLAQNLAQLQTFIAAFLQERMGQLAPFGPT